jgi:catechol 2,3-dioxygenase-like lactoylglutathione lyase family enzyme
VDFYTSLLGFKIHYAREEEGFAMLEREGAMIMLDKINPGSERTWITGAMEQPFGRGINLQIEVASVMPLYSGVKKNGAKIFLDLEEKWYRIGDNEGGNKQFIVQDPDGYLLRFFENLGQRPLIK